MLCNVCYGTSATFSVLPSMSATRSKADMATLPGVFATVMIEELAGLRWPQGFDQIFSSSLRSRPGSCGVRPTHIS